MSASVPKATGSLLFGGVVPALKAGRRAANVADLTPGQTYTGGVAPSPVSLTAKAPTVSHCLITAA
jgi:hypothetical protein